MLCVFLAWEILCFAAFVSGRIMSSHGAPRWLPLPWSDFEDFVESADGKVFVDIAFYNRVLCYSQDGKFVASYPYPFGVKDTGLAASADGRVFFRGARHLHVYDTQWRLQATLEGESYSARNFALDDDGNPVYVPGDRTDRTVVHRLAKPGDRLFAKERERTKFECKDGSTLVRQGNRLQRFSADGTPLATYQALAIYRPFTFPWPAALSWPAMLFAIWLCLRRNRSCTGENK
jgi:hypothetical protein